MSGENLDSAPEKAQDFNAAANAEEIKSKFIDADESDEETKKNGIDHRKWRMMRGFWGRPKD